MIVSDYPPSIGGTEIATKHIAETLYEHNNEVVVITSERSNVKILDSKVKVYRVLNKYRTTLKRLLSNIIKLYDVVSKYRSYDVMHLQAFTLLSLQSSLIAKMRGMPVVVYGRGSDVYLAHKSFKTKLIVKSILMISTSVVVLSNDMAQQLLRISNSNFEYTVIPNGLNNIFLGELTDKKYLRQKHGYDDSYYIITTVSVLRPIKGVEYLIDAFHNPVINDGNTLLLIVGDGESKNNLEGLKKQYNLTNLIFLGAKTSTQIKEILTLSDLFVLPSLSESFGLVNIEAMSCGLPVVASNVGGIPEIVTPTVNGELVAPRSSQELVNAILKIKNDKDYSSTIGKRNLIAACNYSWDNVCYNLSSIYNKAIRGQ